MKIKTWILFLFVSLFVIGCQSNQTDKLPTLGAGFRFSTYGPGNNPGPEYWGAVGKEMASKFRKATPQAIWILGTIYGEGTYLNFPCASDDPYIACGYVDMNEAYLTLFDEQGVDVWLQVEPGNADIETLIDIILEHYGHHPCVIGFGLDVEWYKSTTGPLGEPITDIEAEKWVAAVRNHNPEYFVFLKHWEFEWMPPNTREGIFFINDKQDFESKDEMISDFRAWGDQFKPYPVGYQFGYISDRNWWNSYPDPAYEIGQSILDAVSNTRALFWVDFTVLEVFPPH